MACVSGASGARDAPPAAVWPPMVTKAAKTSAQKTGPKHRPNTPAQNTRADDLPPAPGRSWAPFYAPNAALTRKTRFAYKPVPSPARSNAGRPWFWPVRPRALRFSAMFAVIKTGGKQYRVAAGDEIVVERLEGEPGAKVAFEDVLLVADGDKVQVGAPVVKGASVTGELVGTRKGEKVLVFKKRRRNTYRRKRGHRQVESVVKITQVSA